MKKNDVIEKNNVREKPFIKKGAVNIILTSMWNLCSNSDTNVKISLKDVLPSLINDVRINYSSIIYHDDDLWTKYHQIIGFYGAISNEQYDTKIEDIDPAKVLPCL